MKPIIKGTFVMEKYPGKGGWTYVKLPQIENKSKLPFRFLRVKGHIDGFEISQYHLMPMGDGHLFLPVRAEIRKKIKKEAGQPVSVLLYPDNDPIEVPEEFQICLNDEPRAMQFFQSLADSEKQHYIQWIYSAKKLETRAGRIVKAIDRLAMRKKMYDVIDRAG